MMISRSGREAPLVAAIPLIILAAALGMPVGVLALGMEVTGFVAVTTGSGSLQISMFEAVRV